MGYYSFVAFAKCSVVIPKHLIALGEGINTFTAVTDDLEGFKALLENEGVDVREVHRLDKLSPMPTDSLLIPGESPSAVIPLLNMGKKNPSG